MLKRISIVVAIMICLSFTGCSGVKIDDISVAQKKLIENSSGELVVSSSYTDKDKSDSACIDFLYKYVGDNMQYSLVQKDKNGKPVMIEYCGEVCEQWLIGSGWNKTDNPNYSRTTQHNFLSLLTTPLEPKSIKAISPQVEGNVVRYIIEMNAEQLNKTTYESADAKLVTQTITFVLDNENIVEYDNTSTFKKNDKEVTYNLDVILSKQNENFAITKQTV